MFYKILEKYSQIKGEHSIKQDEENKKLLAVDEEVLKNFLELYDKDVKTIHTNQEQIEKDLQFLYKETDKLANTTKSAVEIYDNFVEYLKEAGDIYNWCNMLEKDMVEVHNLIASKYHKPTPDSHFLQELGS